MTSFKPTFCHRHSAGAFRKEYMTESKKVNLAGRSLDRSRHVCAFFHSKDEGYRVLLPFMKEGFEQGHKAFHIVEEGQRDEHRARLEREGIDVLETEASRQLEIRGWHDTYLRDGHFDQYRMLALIKEVLETGKAQGFPMTRLVANMAWALEDRDGVEDVVEYETRLNFLLPKYDDAVC